ncbi:outer membrane protein [Pseudomonas sp. NFPP33]|jgi:outer membrane protein|nr:MipA/OmpV family protein [Pseudomonas sp. NFPP33]SDA77046.1 outer membrane protein [Pseudomonas sp. NFPP33]
MQQHKLSRASRAANNLGLIAAVMFSAAWAPLVFAQDNGGQWSLGIGAAVIDKPYRDFDREVKPLPVISYENKWLSASIPTFDVKLYATESLSLRLRARWAGDGYEAQDSPVLAGMDEREASIWAGGAVIWKTGFANISGEVLADAMGNSKGTRAKLQIDRRFAAGKFGFTPRLAVEWVDDKYVDYYYGVRQSEARADRAFYEGEATTNVQFGLRTDYTPTHHHTVFLDIGATRFGSTVEDSPLVDKANQTSLALGYVYRF